MPRHVQIPDDDLKRLLGLMAAAYKPAEHSDIVREALCKTLVDPETGALRMIMQMTTELSHQRAWLSYMKKRITPHTPRGDIGEDIIQLALEQDWICASCNLVELRLAINGAITRALEQAKTGN